MNSHRGPLPSLPAIAAFEAAARHGSFTRAAEELNLTQGAVSRQVAGLEALLGVKLFERVRQRVMLTPAGAAYAVEAGVAIAKLRAATLAVMAFRGAPAVLNLAILPTFGTRWLIPRLPRFFASNPNVTINFATRILPFDFAREDLDAAIHFGTPHWAGARLDRLMGEDMVPVASADFLRRYRVRHPSDILGLPLLQQATRPHAWENWLRQNGVVGEGAPAWIGTPPDAAPGPRFEQFAMVAQAAVAGLGIAIVPRFLVEDELRRGDLIMPFDAPARSSEAYYLVCPEEKAQRPTIAAFRGWLLEEVARS